MNVGQLLRVFEYGTHYIVVGESSKSAPSTKRKYSYGDARHYINYTVTGIDWDDDDEPWLNIHVSSNKTDEITDPILLSDFKQLQLPDSAKLMPDAEDNEVIESLGFHNMVVEIS